MHGSGHSQVDAAQIGLPGFSRMVSEKRWPNAVPQVRECQWRSFRHLGPASQGLLPKYGLVGLVDDHCGFLSVHVAARQLNFLKPTYMIGVTMGDQKIFDLSDRQLVVM